MMTPSLHFWPSRKRWLTLLSFHIQNQILLLISLQMPLTLQLETILQQYINRCWCPIAYFSKKLQPAETRYSTFDRELLAIYLAIKHFRHFVEVRTFHILTDHKPLTYALATHSDKHSPRQIRHLDYISQFISDIRHVKGADNLAADALSRIGAYALQVTQPLVLDFNEMAAAQQSDLNLLQLRNFHSSLTLKEVPLPMSDTTIVCDVSTGVPRPFVPLKFRRSVFDSLSHLASMKHRSWSLLGMFGLVLTRMCVSGQNLTCSAQGRKY